AVGEQPVERVQLGQILDMGRQLGQPIEAVIVDDAVEAGLDDLVGGSGAPLVEPSNRDADAAMAGAALGLFGLIAAQAADLVLATAAAGAWSVSVRATHEGILDIYRAASTESRPTHSTTRATSWYRHRAFASIIWRGVWHSGSNSLGLPTRTQAHRARDVATLNRFRSYRNSM